MAAHPKLTIGIPVKDGENFLAALLDSILEQDFGDFEIFVSENGSTDGTLDILADYARRDARLRYVSDPVPMGQSPNHTKVVQEARGEWVKLMCHDDLMRHDCMGQFAEAVASADERVGIMVCGERSMFANGYVTPAVEGAARSRHDGRAVVRGLFGGREICPMPSITTACVRKTAFEQMGGFDARFDHHDTVGWVRLMLMGWDIVHLPDSLVDVRYHPGQITHALRKSMKNVADYKQFIPEFMAEFPAELGLTPSRRLRMNLMPVNAAARTLAVEARGRRYGNLLSGLAKVPLPWWPLMPPLIARSWLKERKRLAHLEGKVPSDGFNT